jgi:hypothetical protein
MGFTNFFPSLIVLTGLDTTLCVKIIKTILLYEISCSFQVSTRDGWSSVANGF